MKQCAHWKGIMCNPENIKLDQPIELLEHLAICDQCLCVAMKKQVIPQLLQSGLFRHTDNGGRTCNSTTAKKIFEDLKNQEHVDWEMQMKFLEHILSCHECFITMMRENHRIFYEIFCKMNRMNRMGKDGKSNKKYLILDMTMLHIEILRETFGSPKDIFYEILDLALTNHTHH